MLCISYNGTQPPWVQQLVPNSNTVNSRWLWLLSNKVELLSRYTTTCVQSITPKLHCGDFISCSFSGDDEEHLLRLYCQRFRLIDNLNKASVFYYLYLVLTITFSRVKYKFLQHRKYIPFPSNLVCLWVTIVNSSVGTGVTVVSVC